MRPFFFILATIILGSSVAQADACKTSGDQSLSPDRIVKRQSINLVKEYQEVIRRDCHGNVASDKTEVVTKPQDSISIENQGWFKITSDKSTAYNRTTCEDPGLGSAFENMIAMIVMPLIPALESKLDIHYVTFVVNTDDDFGMEVRPGDNYIDYQFANCTAMQKDDQGKDTTDCATQNVLEKGTLVLTVNYQEHHLNGTKDIPADANTCKAKNGT